MNRRDELIEKYTGDIKKLIEDGILTKKFDKPISHLMLICAKNKRFIEEDGISLDLKEIVKNVESRIDMKIVSLFIENRVITSSGDNIVILPYFQDHIKYKHPRPDLSGLEIVHQGNTVAKVNEEGWFEEC